MPSVATVANGGGAVPNKRRPVACSWPGCPNVDCQEHQSRDERQSAHHRGYDRTWRKLRLLVLAEEPLCRFCLEEGRVRASEHVDHIIPLRERPDLRLVRSNLRGLCESCHNRRKHHERRTD